VTVPVAPSSGGAAARDLLRSTKAQSPRRDDANGHARSWYTVPRICLAPRDQRDERSDGPTGRHVPTTALLVQRRCGALRRRLVLGLPRATMVERGARAKGLAVPGVSSTDAPPSRGRARGAHRTGALIADRD
jgi:hypothetical protein